MPKLVRLEPIAQTRSVDTQATLLSVLLHQDLDVLKECGGRGTLEVITSCKRNSRLACQARVLGDGVVLELPPGMYVRSLQDLEALIGRRAQSDLLHPITGQILVQAGKLVTRSVLRNLKDVKFEVGHYFSQTREHGAGDPGVGLF
jgi:hypothetical protein